MSDDEMALLTAACSRSDGHANVLAGTVREIAEGAGLTHDAATLAARALQRGNYLEIDADKQVHRTGPGAVWCRQPRTG